MQRFKLFLPLVVFAVVALLFYVMIIRIDRGEYNPHQLPSALVNRPFPKFKLGRLAATDRMVSRKDLLGRIALVNVWATWCPTCREEHGFLVHLARDEGVLIYGVSYKDQLSDARQWLKQHGNPYRLTIYDPKGSLGLNMGVTGAPETFLIDQRGFVRMRYQGPLDETVWREKFQAKIKQIKREQSGDSGSATG